MCRKLIAAILLVGLVHPHLSLANESPDMGFLPFNLSVADLESLQTPIFTTQTVMAGSQRILLVSRDYGSGLELRDAFIYRWTSDTWTLLAFRRTNSSRVTARVKARDLQLIDRSDTVVLAIPVDSLVEPSESK